MRVQRMAGPWSPAPSSAVGEAPSAHASPRRRAVLPAAALEAGGCGSPVRAGGPFGQSRNISAKGQVFFFLI